MHVVWPNRCTRWGALNTCDKNGQTAKHDHWSNAVKWYKTQVLSEISCMNFTPIRFCSGGRDSLLVRAPDSWLKGCKFRSGQERQENFLLKSWLCVLTLIWCPFHPCVTAVASERPWSFCKKCRWQVNLNMHTPLTQWSLSGLTMPLSRHSVGTYPEMNSHTTCQGTFGHSRLSSLSYCGLILA